MLIEAAFAWIPLVFGSRFYFQRVRQEPKHFQYVRGVCNALASDVSFFLFDQLGSDDID